MRYVGFGVTLTHPVALYEPVATAAAQMIREGHPAGLAWAAALMGWRRHTLAGLTHEAVTAWRAR